MASESQLRALTPLVIEAQEYCRWHGDNDNRAFGQLIVEVDKLLLHWARNEVDDEMDVENLVAEAGAEMFANFRAFRGTTGAEFYACERKIVERSIARIRRLREAGAKGGLRRRLSLDNDTEAARLAELLESPEPSPPEACIRREMVALVRRGLRRLSFDELRVVRLLMDGISLREIAASFRRSPCWVQNIWESAAQRLRSYLMRRVRPKTAPSAGG